MKKNYFALFITLTILLSSSVNLKAQEYREWNGTGNWSNNANWNGGDYTYGQLEFKGLGNTTSNNDLNPASQWRLFFQGTQAYTLTGNQVILKDFGGLNSWVLSQSTVDQNLNFDVSFADDGARTAWITTQNTGDLIFNGNIDVAGNVTEMYLANSLADGRIVVNGVISGDEEMYIGRDQNFTTQATTSVEFTGANTYAADTFIDGGSLTVSGSGTLGSNANVFVSAGTVLSVENSLSVTSVQERGSLNGGTIDLSSTGTLSVGGWIGEIFQNTITGTGNLVKNGTGTWTLYGDNPYTGTTTINGGVLRINNVNGLGTTDGLVTVNSGAVLELNVDTDNIDYPTQNLVLNGTGISDGGALRKIAINEQNYLGNISLGSNSRINVTGGTLDFRGDMDLAGNTVYLGGNQNFFFGSGSNLLNATKTTDDGAIFKDGTGTLTIRPSSIITGNITLASGEIRQATGTYASAGTLIIQGGNYRSDGASRTVPKAVSIQGDFTLGHSTGDTGSMTLSGDVDLNAANRKITMPNKNTISGVISNGTLIKDGAGTLLLSAANTYSGNTEIDNGELWIEEGGSAGSSTVYVGNGGQTSNVTKLWISDLDGDTTFSSNIIINQGDLTTRKMGSFNTSGTNTFSGTITNNSSNGLEIIALDAAGTVDISNTIDSSNGILINGTEGVGTVIFSGDQSYSGATTVSAGILKLQGSLANSDVTVKSGATLEIDGGVTLKSLTVEAGGNVLVNPGMSLTVANSLTNSGTITLNSTSITFSSIIPSTVSGSGITQYNRYTSLVGPTGTNDLISPPLSGQLFGDFAENNTNLASDNLARAFAPFNNNSGTYQNYSVESSPGAADNDDQTELFPDTGYRAATTDGSNLTFEGSISTGLESVAITDETGTFGFWNLIGNPYPSYISFKEFFDLVSDVQPGPIGGPLNQLNPLYTAVYGYDGDASDGWTVWDFNNTSYATDLIAPGQGFFVASKTGGGTVNFTPSMRRTGSSDDFIPSRTSIGNFAHTKLLLADSENIFSTNIYFRDFNTRGLDPGYDTGGHFSNDLGIFTQLVENNIGVNLVNQSLPFADLDNIVVPIGIISPSGKQINISLDSGFIIPNNFNVYLEDNVANTWTLLNTNDYVFTPSVDLDGTGRFFVHFTTGTLSAEDTIFNSVQIYSDNLSKEVVINGQLHSGATIKIYDLQGRQVIYQDLNEASTSNRINVNRLNSGLYIVELSDYNKKRTQKIIIK